MRPTIARIKAAVQLVTGVDPSMQSQSWVYSRARQIAMYLAREETQRSFPEIGRDFGGYHHTRAMRAWKAVREKLKVDPLYAAEVKEIRKLLANGNPIKADFGTALMLQGTRLVYAPPEFIRQLAKEIAIELRKEGSPNGGHSEHTAPFGANNHGGLRTGSDQFPVGGAESGDVPQ